GIENGSALIVDIGHFNCNLTPIFRGNIVSEGLLRGRLGGNNITTLLEREIIPLIENTKSYSIIDPYYLANDVKEALSFVSLSPKREFKQAMEGKLTKIIPLFQNEAFEIHIPLFNCSEVLFNPGLFKVNEYSLKDLIKKSVLNCTNTLRRELAQNIILTGGCSLLRGLRERLIREMIGQLGDLEFNIIGFQEFNEPKYSAWIGASKIYSSGQDLSPIRITFEQFTKSGGEIKLNPDYYSYMTELTMGSLKVQLPPMNATEIALPLKYSYDILFNILTQYRKISISEISELILIPELKILKMIYTLLARNFIDGEIDHQSYEFINRAYGVVKREAEISYSKSTPSVSKSYGSVSQEQEYEPQISEGLIKKMQVAQQEEPKISLDDNVPTFLKIDEIKKQEWESEDSPVITEEKAKKLKRRPIVIESKPQTEVTDTSISPGKRKRKLLVLQETEFTFQKVDKELQKEWESEENPILTPEKEQKLRLQKIKKLKELTDVKIKIEDTQIPQRKVNQLPEELLTGPSFLYLDKLKQEKVDNKKPSSEVKEAKSYYDLLDSRTKPKETKKLDAKLLTSEDLLFSSDEESKQDFKEEEVILKTKMEKKEVKSEGELLLGLEKEDKKDLITKEVPRDARIFAPDIPTFQLLEQFTEPKKEEKDVVDLDGLLQSAREPITPKKKIEDTNIPTFLKLENVSEEQLRKIREIEEEERKKKEKEPKLL
ncbi:MAG: hypothetical protein ACTSPQ_11730, partial [Candidatus Helarchaeota archaeon]